MWRGPEEDPSGAGPPPDASSQELSDLKEQNEQQQVLIAQLKEMLRKTEQTNVSQEKVEAYANTLSKMNARAKKAKIRKEQQGAAGITESTGPTKKVETAATEKISLLKKQLEENKAKFAERGKSQKGLEHMVTQLRAQLDDSQLSLISHSTPLNLSLAEQHAPLSMPKIEYTAESNPIDLYNALVAKERLVEELNGKVSKLEGNVLDLQENLKEKDSVIDARTKAITLMSENLSKKGKHTLDQLDETKEQMRKMQEKFIEFETTMKEENQRLQAEVEDKTEQIEKLRTVNHELEIANSELQTKNLALETELAEKCSELNKEPSASPRKEHSPSPRKDHSPSPSRQVKKGKKKREFVSFDSQRLNDLELENAQLKTTNSELTNQVENMKKQLESKLTEQDADDSETDEVTKLKKQLDDSNKNMIKFKAQHKAKVKDLTKKIDAFKKIGDVNAEVVRLTNENGKLTQKLAELEEEKGNLQLKIVEMENGAKDQEIEEYKQKIALLTQRLDVLSDMNTDTVSSEMASINFEEQLENVTKEKEKLLTEKSTLLEQIEGLKQEKQEISTKLDTYMQENIELIDKLEKLSAEKVSSAESIEIVENLTQQEKLEIEAFQKRLNIDAGNLKTSQEQLVENPELNESVSQLTEETSELLQRIELFTEERKEVMEKMEMLSAENSQLSLKLKEVENNHEVLVETYEHLQTEKEELDEKLEKYIEENKKLTNQIKEIQEAKSSKEEGQIEIKERDEFEKEIANYKEEVENYKKEVESYKEEIANYKEEINSYKEEIGNYKEEIANCKEAIQNYKDEIENYKESLERQGHEKSEIDMLSVENYQKQLDDSQKLIDSLKEEVEMKNRELQEKLLRIEELQASKDDKESGWDTEIDVSNAEVYQKQLEDSQKIINSLKEELQEKLAKIEELQALKEDKESGWDTEIDVSSAEVYQKQLEDSQKIISSLKEELETKTRALEEKLLMVEELQNKEGGWESMKYELESKTNELESIRIELHEKTIELEDKVNEAEALSDQITKQEALIVSLNENMDRSNMPEILEALKIQVSENLKEFQRYEQQIAENSETITNLKDDLENLNTKLLDYEHTLLSKDDRIKELENEIVPKEERIKKLEAEIRGKDEHFHEICTTLKEKCMALEARIEEDLESSKAPLEKRIQELETKNKEQLEKMKKIAAKLKMKNKEYLELEAKYKNEEQKVESVAVQKEQLQKSGDEESKEILKQKLEEKEEELRSFVEKLKYSEEELKSYIEKLQNSEEELKSYINRLQNSEEETRSYSERLHKSEDETRSYSERLHKSEEELKSYFERLQNSEEELSKSLQNLRTCEEELHSVKEELKLTQNKLVEKEKKVESLLEQLQELENEFERKNEENNELGCEIKDLKNQLNSSMRDQDNEKESEELRQQLAEALSDNSRKDAKIRELELYTETIEGELSNCKERVSRLEEAISIIEERRLSLENTASILGAQLEEKSNEFEEVSKIEDELESRLKTLMQHDSMIEKRLKEAESKILELSETVEVLTSEKLTLQNALHETNTQNSSLRHLEEENEVLKRSLQNAEKKAYDLEEKCEKLSEELKENEEKMYGDVEQQIRSFNEERTNLIQQVEHLKEQIVFMENNQEKLNNQISSYQEKLEEQSDEFDRKLALVESKKEEQQEEARATKREQSVSPADFFNASKPEAKVEVSSFFDQFSGQHIPHEQEEVFGQQQANLLQESAFGQSLPQQECICPPQQQNVFSQDIPQQQGMFGQPQDFFSQFAQGVQTSHQQNFFNQPIQSVESEIVPQNMTMQTAQPQDFFNQFAAPQQQPQQSVGFFDQFQQQPQNIHGPEVPQSVDATQQTQPSQSGNDAATLKDQEELIKKLQKELQEYINQLETKSQILEQLNLQVQTLTEERQHLDEQIQQMQANQAAVLSAPHSTDDVNTLNEKIKTLEFMLYNSDKEKQNALVNCQQLSMELGNLLYEKQEKPMQKQDDIPDSVLSQIVGEHETGVTAEEREALKKVEFGETHSSQQQLQQQVVEEVIPQPKTAYLCYEDNETAQSIQPEDDGLIKQQKKDVLTLEGDPFDDGWTWSGEEAKMAQEEPQFQKENVTLTMSGNDVNRQVEELEDRIKVLEMEREKHLDELNQSQVKCGKLLKKLKEFKMKNEQLQQASKKGAAQSSGGFDFGLDDAILDELKSQIKQLEKLNKEAKMELEKEKNEKENVLKRVEVLTSANERMLEMKEKQDVEMMLLHKRHKEVSEKLEQLEWGEDFHQQSTPTSSTNNTNTNVESLNSAESEKLNEKIKELSLDNEELQTLLEEERSKRIALERSKSIEPKPENLRTEQEYLALLEEKNRLSQRLDDIENEFIQLQEESRKEIEKLNAEIQSMASVKQENSQEEVKSALEELSRAKTESARILEESEKVKQESEKLKEDSKKAQEELSQIQEEFSKLGEENRTMALQKEELDVQLKQVTSQFELSQQEMMRLNEEINQLNSKVLSLEEELRESHQRNSVAASTAVNPLELAEKIDELNERVKLLTNDNESLQSLLEEQRELRIQAEKQTFDNVRPESEYLALLSQKNELNDQLILATKERDRLQQSSDSSISIEELNRQLTEAVANEKQIKDLLEKERAEFARLQTALLDKDSVIEGLKMKMDILKYDFDTSNSSGSVQVLLQEKNELLMQTAALSGQINNLTTENAGLQQQIQELNNRNQELIAELEEKKLQITELNNKLGESEGKLYTTIEQINQEWVAKVDQRGAEVAECWKMHLEMRENEFMQVEQQLRKALSELEERYNLLVNENNELRNNVDAEIRNELDRISALHNQIEERQKTINELKQTNLELNTKISEYESSSTEKDAKLTEYELSLKEKESELEKIAVLEAQIEELNATLRKVIDEKAALESQLLAQEKSIVKEESKVETLSPAMFFDQPQQNLLQEQEFAEIQAQNQINISGYENTIANLQQQISLLTNELEELKMKYIELETLYEQKTALLKKVEDESNQKEEAGQASFLEIDRLNNDLFNLQKVIKERDETIANRVKEISVLEEEVEYEQNVSKKLRENLAESKKECAELTQKLEEHSRVKVESENKKIEDLEDAIEKQNVRISELEYHIMEKTREYEELQTVATTKLQEQTLLMQSTTSNYESTIDHQRLKIEQLERDLFEKSKDCDALIAEIEIRKSDVEASDDHSDHHHETTTKVKQQEEKFPEDDLTSSVSRAELDLAMYMLHQRDVRCEELTVELMQLLEERDTLQLRLSNAIREKEELRRKISVSSRGGEGDATISSPMKTSTGTIDPFPSTVPLNVTTTQPVAAAGPSTSKPEDTSEYLQHKLSELKSLSYRKDKTILDEQERRRLQDSIVLQQNREDFANLPPEAAARLVNANCTLSRDVQSPSKVLLNWLWGTSTPKVNDV